MTKKDKGHSLQYFSFLYKEMKCLDFILARLETASRIACARLRKPQDLKGHHDENSEDSQNMFFRDKWCDGYLS